jgi:hypothetical protein
MGFGVLHRKEIINCAFEISLPAATDVRHFFTSWNYKLFLSSNSFKVHTNTTVDEREAGVCLYRFPGRGGGLWGGGGRLLIDEHLEHQHTNYI